MQAIIKHWLIVCAIVAGGAGVAFALDAENVKERSDVIFQELYQEADGSLQPVVPEPELDSELPAYLEDLYIYDLGDILDRWRGDPKTIREKIREYTRFQESIRMHALTEMLKDSVTRGREQAAREKSAKEAELASLLYRAAVLKCQNRQALREAGFQGPC